MTASLTSVLTHTRNLSWWQNLSVHKHDDKRRDTDNKINKWIKNNYVKAIHNRQKEKICIYRFVINKLCKGIWIDVRHVRNISMDICIINISIIHSAQYFGLIAVCLSGCLFVYFFLLLIFLRLSQYLICYNFIFFIAAFDFVHCSNCCSKNFFFLKIG